MQNYRCLLCGHESFYEPEIPPGLNSISSDIAPYPKSVSIVVCRTCGHVQKPLTPEWQADVDAIYAQYTNYALSDGGEQMIFAGKIPQARSAQLVQALQTRDIVGKTGRLLDVGCGNGAMLRSFSHFLPDWELAGQEVNDRFRDTVISIPQVTDFYVGAVSEIPHEFEFDMITLLHVLEHIPQPLEFLRGLMQKRASNGVIFIQVPNFLNNPYDLLVYDHCSHFTAATLAYLARALPSPTAEAPAEWIHKEWSLCLQPDADSTIHAASQHPPANIQAVEEHLAWLEHVYNRAQSLAQAAHFGIFGTATAGTWLGGVLGEAVDFFTDEDERKWGKTHLTRPVISPQDIPPDSLVFLAFSQELAAQIQVRLQPQYPDITFVLPLEESYDE